MIPPLGLRPPWRKINMFGILVERAINSRLTRLHLKIYFTEFSIVPLIDQVILFSTTLIGQNCLSDTKQNNFFEIFPKILLDAQMVKMHLKLEIEVQIGDIKRLVPRVGTFTNQFEWEYPPLSEPSHCQIYSLFICKNALLLSAR